MFDHTDMTEPRYTIRTGLDGLRYAVFRDEIARADYERDNPGEFLGCRVASFGQYDNAFVLGEQTSWMPLPAPPQRNEVTKSSLEEPRG